MLKTKKIINKKIHWFLSAIILMSIILFCGYQIGIKAVGSRVFAGEITVQIPMATCANYYSCSACSLCGCGSWDQLTITPKFGIEPNSTFYMCKMPSLIPWGNGNLIVGSIVFGYAPSEHVNVNDGNSTNIWSVFQ